jgi:hypothetical protein
MYIQLFGVTHVSKVYDKFGGHFLERTMECFNFALITY